MPQKLSIEDFQHVVRCTPLVSIDLVVRTSSGKVLVGRRNNEPAKGKFFVPGGRILKDEKFADAFLRLTEEELGVKIALHEARPLGVFEHLYPTNAFEVPGFGTHYVVHAYEISWHREKTDLPRVQHSQYRWITKEEALADATVDDYTRRYLKCQNMS